MAAATHEVAFRCKRGRLLRALGAGLALAAAAVGLLLAGCAMSDAGIPIGRIDAELTARVREMETARRTNSPEAYVTHRTADWLFSANGEDCGWDDFVARERSEGAAIVQVESVSSVWRHAEVRENYASLILRWTVVQRERDVAHGQRFRVSVVEKSEWVKTDAGWKMLKLERFPAVATREAL